MDLLHHIHIDPSIESIFIIRSGQFLALSFMHLHIYVHINLVLNLISQTLSTIFFVQHIKY